MTRHCARSVRTHTDTRTICSARLRLVASLLAYIPLLALPVMECKLNLLLHHSSPSLQATISYYQIMHMQTVVLPVHYQTLCESSKLYDPGQQYAAHVRDLQLTEEPEVTYQFEPYTATAASTQ